MNIISVIFNEKIELKIKKIFKEFNQIKYMGNFKLFSNIYINPKDIDMLFVEIDKNKMEYMQILQILKEKYPSIIIVLICDNIQYAFKAFEINVSDYLLLDFNENRLLNTLRRSEKFITSKIKVQMFHSFKISNIKGEFIKFRTHKTKELCSYLFYNKNKYLKKELIIEEIWPEYSNEKAYKQLYNSIYYLRQSIEKENLPFEIVNFDDSYLFKQNKDIIFDLDMFENLCSEEKCDGRKIAKIYKTGFLYEDGYLWSKEYYESFKKTYLVILDNCFKAAIKNGDIDRALFLCEKAIEEDSYNEDRYLKLLKIIKDNRSKKEYLIKLKEIEVFFQNELKIKFNSAFSDLSS